MRTQLSLVEETLAEEREKKMEKENELNSMKRLFIHTYIHTYIHIYMPAQLLNIQTIHTHLCILRVNLRI